MEIEYSRLKEIVESYNTPFYIYDEKGIRDHCKYFLNTIKKYLPNFTNYFAVKALPNIHILKILYEEGMKFDCSSVTELMMITEYVTKNGNDILYSSNYTSVEDLTYALQKNVTINLDDIDCFDNMMIAIKKNNLEIPKIISFRLNPLYGSTDSKITSNILSGENSKFGIPRDKIVDAYLLAKKYGVTEFGIHVMTGSCIMNVDYWRDLIDIVFETINEIYYKTNIEFKFVDLGGGIGISYTDNTHVDIELLGKIIKLSVDENIEKYKLPFNPQIIMENGRFITGKYGLLISKCVSIKNSYNDSVFYGLDACMSNLMRPGMYGAYHKISVPRLENENETIKCNIVGSLCENNDWFAKDREMPKGIIKNDIFVIHDVGAHGHCMGFQYNGKLRSSELLLESDGGIKMIRIEDEPYDIFRKQF